MKIQNKDNTVIDSTASETMYWREWWAADKGQREEWWNQSRPKKCEVNEMIKMKQVSQSCGIESVEKLLAAATERNDKILSHLSCSGCKKARRFQWRQTTTHSHTFVLSLAGSLWIFRICVKMNTLQLANTCLFSVKYGFNTTFIKWMVVVFSSKEPAVNCMVFLWFTHSVRKLVTFGHILRYTQ